VGGCARYVITDVSTDGMLQGPNVELYRTVTDMTATPIIASGGISAIGDLVELAELCAIGKSLEGAIIGAALYAGRFTLPDAIEAVRRIDTPSGSTK
jgi:phosphoribosyl isomerase A